MGLRNGSSRLRSWLGVLALIAITVRGFIPAGYMLEASAEPGRFIEIAFCHGDGVSSGPVYLDLATGELGDQGDDPNAPDDDEGSWTCPCALTAQFALPAPAGALALPVRPAGLLEAERAGVSPGRGLAAPPPPVRGPPSFL